MKRVLLIASSTLFGRGVEGLLLHEPDLEFLGCEADVHRAHERVEALKPDVVIIMKEGVTNGLGDTLRSALQACGHIRVIELDPQDNAISIYLGQQRVVKQVEDLVEAIMGDTRS